MNNIAFNSFGADNTANFFQAGKFQKSWYHYNLLLKQEIKASKELITL